jgi:phosphoglycolate phosphatase
MTSKFDKIFFDLDGTLSDSYQGIENGIRYALGKAGISDLSEQDVKKLIGLPLHLSLDKYYFNDTQKTWEAVECFREYYGSKGVYESILYDGIAELLGDLSIASEIYVITAKPTPFAEKLLAGHNVAHLFTAIMGCEMDGANSCKSDLIKKVNDVNCSIIVGDKQQDISAGKEAGIKTCGVLYGYGTEQEIVGAAPDFIIDTVINLRNLLCN